MKTMILAVIGLLLGLVLWLSKNPHLADLAWSLAVIIILVPLGISVARDLLHRETGVDLIALLAMLGSLLLGQYLAGAVVGLMLSGGQVLESYASQRAARELKSLLSRVPNRVSMYMGDLLEVIDIEKVARGDLLLIKPGEVIPVDGELTSSNALLDESALTGESLPVEHFVGDFVSSGGINSGGPFDLRAVATAQESTYAGIVRLVQEAVTSKAPFVRLADRYALIFLPLALLLALFAWLISGSPLRALAVLVVATPCPLILAAPVAIIAGISRSAKRGIIIKGGGALETLARAKTLVFDKTGTLTTGTPRVSRVESFGVVSHDDLIRLAASLDQVSPHVYASAIISAARDRNLSLEMPLEVMEKIGSGVTGMVGGKRVSLGKSSWLSVSSVLSNKATLALKDSQVAGLSSVLLAIEGIVEGVLFIEDPMRADTPRAMERLRQSGIERIVVLTGDKKEVALAISEPLGVDEVIWERSPREKVESVLLEKKRAVTVMVGDGVNDAPALSAADVGIALAARGSTASSEAADIVIVVDLLDRVAEAMDIARRSRRIALQSVVAGMGLSGLGMILASFGILPPIAGAIFQELIDVAVILNALRALGGDPSTVSLKKK